MSAARSATGFGVIARAGAQRAELAQDARDRRERRAVERIGSVRRHDRVEHERFDVARIVLRVLLGDLRPVGGAVQDELFVAARDADRLDVGDAVGRRVEGCASGRAGRRIRRSRRSERSCRRSPVRSGGRTSGCERPMPRWSKTIRSRVAAIGPSRLGELFGERERGLAGAAGERDDRALRFADRRAVAADRERERARRGAARVERHGQVAAGEVVAVRRRARTRSAPARTRAAAKRCTRRPSAARQRSCRRNGASIGI